MNGLTKPSARAGADTPTTRTAARIEKRKAGFLRITSPFSHAAPSGCASEDGGNRFIPLQPHAPRPSHLSRLWACAVEGALRLAWRQLDRRSTARLFGKAARSGRTAASRVEG